MGRRLTQGGARRWGGAGGVTRYTARSTTARRAHVSDEETRVRRRRGVELAPLRFVDGDMGLIEIGQIKAGLESKLSEKPLSMLLLWGTRLPSLLFKGAGGAVELAPGYLKLVYDIVRKAGGVCIADEVQSGFGRTGSHYWGFETQRVIPDIVTRAKKIQFNTFGGNPVCSAGGLAVLRVLDEEKRQQHCVEVGAHLIGRLRTLQQKHDSNFLL
ncbi:Alanine--glyoxylate aminotransferase 2, mitochondrial [Dionaea muscipula]